MSKIPLLLYQRSFTTFGSRTAAEQRRQDFTHRKIVMKTVLNIITLII